MSKKKPQIKMPSLSAPAKLNLYLDITAKRNDGYHDLQSLVVFLDLCDDVSVEAANDISVEGTNFSDEICIKAAKLLQKEFSVNSGVKITIKKNIPVGGGLGGGSADAAATIILLCELWGLHPDNEILYEIALELGADVPACLYALLNSKNAVIFSGIGEKLQPTEIDEMHFVLVNPNKELSTKAVFKNYTFTQQPPKTNHLQQTAIAMMPEIGDILEELQSQAGCISASMTGSGATCFGIFEDAGQATTMARILAQRYPQWWVVSAKTK